MADSNNESYGRPPFGGNYVNYLDNFLPSAHGDVAHDGLVGGFANAGAGLGVGVAY